jgi:hypothetical protein
MTSETTPVEVASIEVEDSIILVGDTVLLGERYLTE